MVTTFEGKCTIDNRYTIHYAAAMWLTKERLECISKSSSISESHYFNEILHQLSISAGNKLTLKH